LNPEPTNKTTNLTRMTKTGYEKSNWCWLKEQETKWKAIKHSAPRVLTDIRAELQRRRRK
jgi:hypothetical protein